MTIPITNRITIDDAEIEYDDTDDGIVICSIIYENAEGIYRMPSAVLGKKVKELAQGFARNIKARELWLPETDGELILQDKCLSGARDIKKIVVSASVKAIPDCCFMNCWAEEIVFSDPSSISDVGDCAFACTEYLHSLEWPVSCKSIPANCFDSSAISRLTGIDNVQKISQEAFQNSGLMTLRWPDKCHYIPDACFYSAVKLRSISNIEHVTKIESYAFCKCKSLKAMAWPTKCFNIPAGCFKDSNLKEITGTEKVKNIEMFAFENSKLETFKWPKACLMIPINCFKMSALKEIIFPDMKLSSIESNAFFQTMLKEVNLPNITKDIACSAFDFSKKLEIVVFPKSQNEIPRYLFAGCSKLKKLIFISPYVKAESSTINAFMREKIYRNTTIDMSQVSELILEDNNQVSDFMKKVDIGFDTNVTIIKSESN